METSKKPVWRIAMYASGRPRKFREGTYQTEQAAEDACRLLRSSIYTYKVIGPQEARETVIDMKARTVEEFLTNHNYILAADFDDASLRLTKIADVMERWAPGTGRSPLRKGYLKSSTGLSLLFEVFVSRQELTRVECGNYTLQETAEYRTARRGGGGSYTSEESWRSALMSSARQGYNQAVRSLVAASIHSDEW